ncbi:hypothetical protein LCGC14_1634150 [marine sediment metagenome]|uniref:Uncharacterized protein n=1 Tax=marine sediment metagenome TaxID=412755 RepID=A0A0F9I1S4_9ZZZZ
MSIINFVQKKGIFTILKQLKIAPLNYNSIKKNIIEYFSARTLDFRLKDLIEFKLIKSNTIKQGKSVKFNYSLTNKGIMMLTLLELINQLKYDDINIDSIQDLFSLKLMGNRCSDFTYTWEKLKEMIPDKKIIYTLKQKKPNKIIRMDNKGITVQTEKGEDLIPIKHIEDAWNNFIQEGTLERNSHEKSTYRSSFMLALFSQLPFVEVNKNPLSLRINTYNIDKKKVD